ncbi:unnamed protein product [Polarella glacialis]|uniref:glucose-6-phosphate 1-epimerase n=1 Tax=Polarella glacialis TaxID=89957 RepID=A0A813L1B4_POLGL|nr:unnamed protein product [Polarella glacialis]
MSNQVEQIPGEGGLEKVKLTRASGASCEVYVYGAHVTSWKTFDGVERLYVSSASKFASGQAIRGGIPICWPQFNTRGTYGKHGFCRSTDSWVVRRIVSDPKRDPSVTIELSDCEASKDFPFSFKLTYTVTLSDSGLTTSMHVVNNSDDPMTFTTALHTYFAVSDVTTVKVSGLQGLKFEDSTKGGEVSEQADEQLMIRGEVDRVYLDTPEEMLITDGDTAISVKKSGFPDSVVWNIGEEKAAGMSDLGAGEWRRYLCVEAGAIGTPVVVEPGAAWVAEQRFGASVAVPMSLAELGEPEVGDAERLNKIEAAFKAKGKASLPLEEAYEIMISPEEKGIYGLNDFKEDVKGFEDQMANKEQFTWEEIKVFLETVG